MQINNNGQLVSFEDDKAMYVLSYNEKPGVQAITLVSETHNSKDYIEFGAFLQHYLGDSSLYLSLSIDPGSIL